ncbi:hypothetical protein PG993_005760 [Apiospora rasikravindrae]|uniref:Aminoglycoside phosphotransferase domain-containing protein n=1 Tax=Apiospora rasikravindrae TaxID=990691 RepID=A0ABR1T9Q8_9PEZI
METSYALPYYAPRDSLPAPLPTVEEIENARDGIKHSWSHRIVRVGTHFVVKYGIGVQTMEGENMLFVKESAPSLVVPNVYAIFSRVQGEEGKGNDGNTDPITINYIVMEYIPGRTLDSCWSRLDDATKTKVVAKLRDYFYQLRQVPSPGYFGAVGRRPFCDDGFVWHREDDEPESISSGPFDSEEQLLDALIAKYEFHSGSLLQGDRRHEYYRYMLPQVLRSGESVFTHGDLQRKNVMIREDNGGGGYYRLGIGGVVPGLVGVLLDHVLLPVEGRLASLGGSDPGRVSESVRLDDDDLSVIMCFWDEITPF